MCFAFSRARFIILMEFGSRCQPGTASLHHHTHHETEPRNERENVALLCLSITLLLVLRRNFICRRPASVPALNFFGVCTVQDLPPHSSLNWHAGIPAGRVYAQVERNQRSANKTFSHNMQAGGPAATGTVCHRKALRRSSLQETRLTELVLCLTCRL